MLFTIGSAPAEMASATANGLVKETNGNFVALVTGGRYNGDDIQLVMTVNLTESFRETAFAGSPDWFSQRPRSNGGELGDCQLHINYLVGPDDEDYAVAKAFVDHHTVNLPVGVSIPIGADGSFQLDGLKGQGYYYLNLEFSWFAFVPELVMSRKNNQPTWVSTKFTWEGKLVRNMGNASKKSSVDDLLAAASNPGVDVTPPTSTPPTSTPPTGLPKPLTPLARV